MLNIFIIPERLVNSRLDKALCELLPDHSRTSIQKAIKLGSVKINQIIIVNPDNKVKENDVVAIELQIQELVLDIKPANISIDVVYEDEEIMVINKPVGLTVHPGTGNNQSTLVNALLFYTDSLSDIGGCHRLGIVHRLDKDTSGLMVVAKTNIAHTKLAAQIEKRTLIRKYKALIWGIMTPLNGVIKNNMGRSKTDRKKMTVLKFGGKYAVTHYKTEKLYLNGLISLVECKLETGRTHQIRVHLSHAGHSVIGDQVYGNNKRKIVACNETIQELLSNLGRQALHSWYIGFCHPSTNIFLEFSTDLPYDMRNILDFIEKY